MSGDPAVSFVVVGARCNAVTGLLGCDRGCDCVPPTSFTCDRPRGHRDQHRAQNVAVHSMDFDQPLLMTVKWVES